MTYSTLWLQERPSSIVKKALWVVSNCLHNLGPVQALNSLSVMYFTGTALKYWKLIRMSTFKCYELILKYTVLKIKLITNLMVLFLT